MTLDEAPVLNRGLFLETGLLAPLPAAGGTE